MIRRHFLFKALGLTAAVAMTALGAPATQAAEKKKGGGVGFTQFPLLTVFTAANSYHHGTLSLDMGIYAADPKLTALVQLYIPRLQDAYMTRLQSYAATLNSRSLVDTDYISTQLQAATNQVLGRNDAKVLLGSALIN